MSRPEPAAPPSAPDPYDRPPSLWQRRPHLGWALAAFVVTALLTSAAFPPINIGESAYVLAIAAVLWAYRRPPFRLFAGTVIGAQVVAWIFLLGWLHHVTWVGLVLLGGFIGLLTSLWYLAAWWAVPRLVGQTAFGRILAMLALASLWVLLEWVRGWILGGFPWLPLAASQWQRPLVLQVAAYAGAGAVSGLLILFNLGAAAYAHRIFFEGATGLRKRSPEFMVALMLLVFASFPLIAEMLGQQRHRLARIAVVQPYIPQTEKWDPSRDGEILRTIERLTLDANERGSPDLIVWPEASTPWALGRDPGLQQWLESLARRTGKPLLLGCVRMQPGATPGEALWHNGAFVIDPVKGLAPASYTKRKLVPFGEYVPLRPLLGWLEKFVPIGGDFEHGASAEPLSVGTGAGSVPVGVLICYEDVFPHLARDNANEGAELLAVLTNNGWFGEGGAAHQHAAHSVLRAVETRRPVLRCGNGGWSGWIDEFGHVRATVTDADNSIYFRGFQTLTVTRDLRWSGRSSFYARHGDWFLALCAGLVLVGYYLVLGMRRPVRTADGEPVF